jgi:hypothetical protein
VPFPEPQRHVIRDWAARFVHREVITLDNSYYRGLSRSSLTSINFTTIMFMFYFTITTLIVINNCGPIGAGQRR